MIFEKTKEEISLNERTKQIWEAINGEWSRNKPRKAITFKEINADKDRLDPVTKQPIMTQSGRRSKMSKKASDFHYLPSISFVSWKGAETEIGYNIRRDRNGNPTRAKIMMSRGRLVVHPDKNPALFMYLDLCPKNQDSPCYKEGSGLYNTNLEYVKPEYYMVDELAKVRKAAKETKDKYKVIGEIQKIERPDKLIHLAKSILTVMPDQEAMEVVEYADVVRYYLIMEAEKNPGKVDSMMKVVTSAGIENIGQARILGLLGHNEGYWWWKPTITSQATPVNVGNMPKQKSDTDENIWIMRELNNQFPEILQALRKEVSTPLDERGEEEEEWNHPWPQEYFKKLDDNGNPILKADGSPDSRYVKPEYKDQV